MTDEPRRGRLSKEELLARAKKPRDNALRLHPPYKGKMLYEEAAKVMREAREATRLLMREGLIPAPSEAHR